MWTHTISNVSSSSESQTEGDSGVGSYRKPPGGTGSTTQCDHTPRYSPETIRKLDKGDLKDAPLSDHGGNNDGDQEMVSGNEGGEEAMGTNPIWPTGPIAAVTGLAVNLAVAPEALEGPEAPLLADTADTDDEKARQDPFQLIMQGFHAATCTLSDGYQQACKEVQNIVQRSMKKSTAMDCTFVWGASAAVRQWVRAVQPAMDCMGRVWRSSHAYFRQPGKLEKRLRRTYWPYFLRKRAHTLLRSCPKKTFSLQLYKRPGLIRRRPLRPSMSSCWPWCITTSRRSKPESS